MTMTKDPMASAASTRRKDGRVKVWDPLVRILHWTIAAGVIANLTFLEHLEEPHMYVGYVVVAAVFIRLIWGFVGTRHARFTDFVPRPRTFVGYIKALIARREPRYLGHNPAGAAMMLTLLGLVSVVGVTGWMMGLDQFWGVSWVEQVHEVAAKVILGAAILHVLGAIIESVRHRENLIGSMITGFKRAPTGTDVDHAPPSR